MCGQEEIIPCGEYTSLLRFPNCGCSPSALYLCEPDDSQPFHKAREISLEDANTLLRRLGLQPLEDVDMPKYNGGFLPLDYRLHQIAGLKLPTTDVDDKDESPTIPNKQEPQAESSMSITAQKARAPARHNAHEAQIKREKRREESQHLVKARPILSPSLKARVPPR